MPNISVFGGSQIKPGDEAYEIAYELGKQLGNSGFTVLTGGYIGSMEAVSRGAAETGTHVIGVTCADIEAWRPVGANRWVIEEIQMKSIPERILTLIEKCDGALALPGGVGTLTEIMMTWNLLLTDSTRSRPIILIGSEWQSFIDYYLHIFGVYIPYNQRRWISIARDPTEAVHRLQETLSSGKV
jgi:uncharacterized protein (TIGR00725 family)